MERIRRRWWTRLITVIAALIVVAATLSGLFRLAMQVVPGYRQSVQARITRLIGMPLRIGAIRLTWRGFEPGLALLDVDLNDARQGKLLHIRKARIDASWWPLLHGELRPSHITISGLTGHLSVAADGHWIWPSLSSGGQHDRQTLQHLLDTLQSLSLRHCTLYVDDARLGGATMAFGLDARLHKARGGDSLRVVIKPPRDMASLATVKLYLQGKPLQVATWSGDWSATLSGLQRLPWLKFVLPGQARLNFTGGLLHASGRLSGGRPVDAQLRLVAAALDADRDGKTASPLHKLRLDVEWQRQANGWLLLLSHFSASGKRGDWASQGQATLQRTAHGNRKLSLNLQRLRLDGLQSWLALWPSAAQLLKPLPRVHGDLEQLSATVEWPARIKARLDYHAQARLAGVGWSAKSHWPGIRHLSGNLVMDQDGGQFRLAPQPPTLNIPKLFAAPVAFDALHGMVKWQRDSSGWVINAPHFDWRLLGSKGQGDLTLDWPRYAATGKRPDIDLTLDFDAADVARLKPLIPLDWGTGLRKWLKRALVSGRVTHGHARLDGPLADFPYDKKPDGHWALNLALDHATLAYARGWLPAKQLAATLKFRGNGLQIDGNAARIDGIRLNRIQAVFDDFDDHQLRVTLAARGEAARFYDFLRHSPLHARLSGLLDHTDLGGPARVTVAMNIPLLKADETTAKGTIRLSGNTLRYRGFDVPLTGLQGQLHFDDHGVDASKLSAKLDGMPIFARITPSRASPQGVLHAHFMAAADQGVLAQWLPHWLQHRLPGRSQWQASLPLGGGQAGSLSFNSDLVGTRILLPAPVGKTGKTHLPMTVSLHGAGHGGLRVAIDAGRRFGLALRLARQGQTAQRPSAGTSKPAASGDMMLRALGVRLGAGVTPVVKQAGVRVAGDSKQLDLGGWFDLLKAAPWAGAARKAGTPAGLATRALELPFLGADLHSRDAYYRRWRLQPVHATVTPGKTGFRMLLDGPGASGTLRWNRRARVVTGRLQHLALKATNIKPKGKTQGSQPRDKSPLDPTRQPTLDLDFSHVTLGDYALGRLQLVTTRGADGQHLKTLKLSGGRVDLAASGGWQRDRHNAGSSAQVGFRLGVQQLGKALQALGFTPSVFAKHAVFSGSLGWPAAEAGVDLAQAQGKIRISMKNGRLKAVKPGAGRVLGLLNLYALPRRLLFNFSDVVDKGLAFDRVSGDFDLDHGVARTHNLSIVGPSLRMDVKGKIGLEAETFDETVTVYPDISTGVTLGALLLGGPIAGGVALLAQQLVGKALDQLTRLSYHVTGSWDNPKVARVGSEQRITPAPNASTARPAPQHAPK